MWVGEEGEVLSVHARVYRFVRLHVFVFVTRGNEGGRLRLVLFLFVCV